MANQPTIKRFTGWSVNKGRYEKITGDKFPGKAGDYVLVPIAAGLTFGNDACGEFGATRTFHFWIAPDKRNVADMVKEPITYKAIDKRAPRNFLDNRVPARGCGAPPRRGTTPSRVREVDDESPPRAKRVRYSGPSPQLSDSQSEDGDSGSESEEHVGLRREGGSESSGRRESSSGSEEDEESSVRGGNSYGSDHECGSSYDFASDGESVRGGNPIRRHPEVIDLSKEQEGSDGHTCPPTRDVPDVAPRT